MGAMIPGVWYSVCVYAHALRMYHEHVLSLCMYVQCTVCMCCVSVCTVHVTCMCYVSACTVYVICMCCACTYVPYVQFACALCMYCVYTLLASTGPLPVLAVLPRGSVLPEGVPCCLCLSPRPAVAAGFVSLCLARSCPAFSSQHRLFILSRQFAPSARNQRLGLSSTSRS